MLEYVSYWIELNQQGLKYPEWSKKDFGFFFILILVGALWYTGADSTGVTPRPHRRAANEVAVKIPCSSILVEVIHVKRLVRLDLQVSLVRWWSLIAAPTWHDPYAPYTVKKFLLENPWRTNVLKYLNALKTKTT